MIANNKKYNK